MRSCFAALLIAALTSPSLAADAPKIQVQDDAERIVINTPELEAAVRKKDYVTGVAAGSFLDKKTGFLDVGYGLDIVDWIMEPGSDEAYRDKLVPEMVYKFGNPYHGNTPKRSLEGPQICTQAKLLDPKVIRGADFVAVTQNYHYKTAAPGYKTGSEWRQTMVFPAGKRYFVSSDRMHVVNSSPAMFFRLDMPGHIKHKGANTFSEVYLSYKGKVPATEFAHDFAPDERLNFKRERDGVPDRVIRAYHLRDPKTGKEGPWLAGMTLEPSAVYEAWCHERGYVCMIEEIGGKPIKAGESFGAAFIVGFFDSIDEMNKVYDEYRGNTDLKVDAAGWQLVK